MKKFRKNFYTCSTAESRCQFKRRNFFESPKFHGSNTDRDNDPEHARERYQLQLDLYSEAVEEIMHEKVAEKFLYMLHGEIIVSI